jgi:hypothetical protein
MVAFVVSDIPSSINTVEALSVWCCAVLNNLHFQQEIQEAPGIIEKVAVSQSFPINNNGVYEWRHVSRSSVKINSTYQQSGKLWQHVVPLSNASIPNDFKS